MATYLVVRDNVEGAGGPGIWFVKTDDLKDLVQKSEHLYLHTYIYQLTAAEVQSPTPWGGMKLKQAANVWPLDGFMGRLTAACNYLSGRDKEQLEVDVARGLKYLLSEKARHLGLLKQIEEDEQTEVFEVNNSPKSEVEDGE